MSMSSTHAHRHPHSTAANHHHEGGPVWLSAAAGLCASLVGLGLARFAYTPLIPALIAAKWFSPADVVYLGAANLAGYLAGALVAREVGARIGAVRSLRAMMVLASLCCFVCSVPISFAWFFVWRFLAGLSGGVIMVLAASTILPHTPPNKKGVVGGVIFAGVGLGVAASGTLVPLLLRQGLQEAWYGLGILSVLLTLASWKAWPAEFRGAKAVTHHRAASRPRSLAIRALYAEYGLNAVALVPHMVFLVDFVARGLGQGILAASQYWVLYGIGAIAGPLVTGHLADRAGFGPALRVAFLVQAVAIVLPAVSVAPAAMIVSSVIAGAFTPGIVPLTLGRIHELVPHNSTEQGAAWAQATTSFALFQAGGAYGLSYCFEQTGGNYALLFMIGAAAITAALAIDLVVGLWGNRARS